MLCVRVAVGPDCTGQLHRALRFNLNDLSWVEYLLSVYLMSTGRQVHAFSPAITHTLSRTSNYLLRVMVSNMSNLR